MEQYRNFIDINQYRYDNDELLKTSKQLCTIDDSEFNIVKPRAVYQKSVKWPPNYTIRIKFLDGQEWQKAWVKKIVNEEIQPIIYPSLSFQFVDNSEYADVKITFKFPGYGASLIGTRCQDTPQNSPTMKLGILDFPKSRKFELNSKIYVIPDNVPETINNTGSVIKHEFGHVLGKYHEHQNPIDNPIIWDVEKTYKYYLEPPEPWDKTDIINNILTRLTIEEVDATPFDPESIMMYTVLPELTKNGIGFKKNDDYSEKDLEWMKNHSIGVIGQDTDYKKYIWTAIVVIFAISIIFVMSKKFIKYK